MSSRIRKLQRIEQGMGRGIRDAEDHCAVLLLGSGVALSLVDPADLAIFSPATRAQINLSQAVAEQIRGEGLGPVREVLSVFLDRDEAWKLASSNATAGVEYESEGHVTAVAEARRKAWELAAVGDPGEAARVLQNALNGLDSAERGWHLEEVAAYQHEVSPADAQKTIKAAKQANKSTLMPTVPLEAKPVRGRAQQAESASDFLTMTYQNGTELQLGVRSLLDDLIFAPGQERTDAAEAAMKLLGLHLGFDATRPEKEEGKGPDGCWGLTPRRTAVIELKTGTTRQDTAITKSEIDQLAGAVNWDAEVNESAECIPVIIAKSAALRSDAAAPQGTRVITTETLDALKGHVQDFAAEVSKGDGWMRPTAVIEALQTYHLASESVIARHSVKPIHAASA